MCVQSGSNITTRAQTRRAITNTLNLDAFTHILGIPNCDKVGIVPKQPKYVIVKRLSENITCSCKIVDCIHCEAASEIIPPHEFYDTNYNPSVWGVSDLLFLSFLLPQA